MPWSVRVQDEMGRPVVPADIEVPFHLLDDLAPDLRMLGGIDRWGDTTFNGLQLRFFITEWQTLTPRLNTPEERIAWEEVLYYAQQCIADPHSYLKFIGD